MARRLDRLEQEMEQAAGQLHSADPLASESLAEALAEARRLALAAAMRSAAADLAENRTGKAAATHKQITAGLQAVLDLLANRRQQELGRLTRDLRQAETDLAALAKQQEGLAARLERVAAQPARQQADLLPLAREQDALRSAAQQLAQRLDRLLAEEAGQTVGRAAGQMQLAAAAAAAGDGPRAVAQAQQALESLALAARRLADRRLQAQAGLAIEQLARLQDALKNLAHRQQDVLEQTRKIEVLRQPPSPPPPLAASPLPPLAASQPPPLTREQAANLAELARSQHAIQTDTAQLAEPLTAGAFRLALLAVRDEMGRAADELARRQTGPTAQQAQQSALDRLAILLTALEPEKPDSNPGSSGGGNANAGNPEGSPGGVRPLAELKLLKLLQQDLATRTKQLYKAVSNQPSAVSPQRSASPPPGSQDTETRGHGDPQTRRPADAGTLELSASPRPRVPASSSTPPATSRQPLATGGPAQADAYAALAQEQGRLADSIGAGRSTAKNPRQDPILDVGRQMRQAQGLLEEHNAGAETQFLHAPDRLRPGEDHRRGPQVGPRRPGRYAARHIPAGPESDRAIAETIPGHYRPRPGPGQGKQPQYPAQA